MIKYKFGDIVLINFLQSDGNKKKRPAMVILDIEDDDIILAPITTQERFGVGDLKIKNWEDSGLLLESWVRLTKISCLTKDDIEKILGCLDDYDQRKIISLWNKVYSF